MHTRQSNHKQNRFYHYMIIPSKKNYGNSDGKMLYLHRGVWEDFEANGLDS